MEHFDHVSFPLHIISPTATFKIRTPLPLVLYTNQVSEFPDPHTVRRWPQETPVGVN